MPRHSPCALISLTFVDARQALSEKQKICFAPCLAASPLQIQTRLRWALNLLGDALYKVRLRLNLVTSRIIHFYLVSLVRIMQALLKKFL